MRPSLPRARTFVHTRDILRVRRYHVRYEESSQVEGAIVSDSLWLGGDPHAIAFGCQTGETGEIYNQKADGIVGLSAAALALPSQLSAAGAIDPEFTICYGDEGGARLLRHAQVLPAGWGQPVVSGEKTAELAVFSQNPAPLRLGARSARHNQTVSASCF